MHGIDALLRPLAKARLKQVQSELDQVPSPVNAARQFGLGTDPDRVLVFGNGSASGFGVRSQELALPGQLARALSAATGRGTEVDLARGRGMVIEVAPKRLRELRLWRYDAVVVTIGATDAGGLLSIDRWERALVATLAQIRPPDGADRPVVLVGIRPQQRSPFGTGWFEDRADRHAERLDAVSARVAAQQPHTSFVGLQPALQSVGCDRYGSAESYRAIAEHVTHALAPELEELHRTGARDRARLSHTRAEPEEQRQEAVDAMGITDLPPTERLQRLVKSASDLFGTYGAALSVIDGDRQWHKASHGLDTHELPRDLSICNRTIQQDGALVVSDATSDPKTAGTGMRANGRRVRFYAGYPIESPDGFRLGALCVFDPEARTLDDTAEEHLRELALRVQSELWEEAGWTARS